MLYTKDGPCWYISILQNHLIIQLHILSLVLTSYQCMSLGADKNFLGSTICMFQELLECLVGMKVSIVTKADETCNSAIHQSSGN